jgi:hypothetical protein
MRRVYYKTIQAKKKIDFTPNNYGLSKTYRVRMHDDAQK